MAVSLSQTEMKALNRCPNTAPAVLPATQHNYHTDCCLDGSSSHCCPVRFLLKALLSEILEDNIAVILRIKERTKSFPLSPHRLKDSLSVFSSFQVHLFCDQISGSCRAQVLASAATFFLQLHFMLNVSWKEKKKQILFKCICFDHSWH